MYLCDAALLFEVLLYILNCKSVLLAWYMKDISIVENCGVVLFTSAGTLCNLNIVTQGSHFSPSLLEPS